MADHASSTVLFQHGLSSGAKLVIYLILSAALLIIDVRFHALHWLRSGAQTLIYPLQMAESAPTLAVERMGAFFVRQGDLLAENQQLHSQAAQWQIDRQALQQLRAENAHLRILLKLSNQTQFSSHAAEIIGLNRDPYRDLLTINRGTSAGIKPGSAVVDEHGLLGQVTETWPLTSQVTLITDKNQSVAVQIQRTGEHAVMFGTGDAAELRYLPHSTDIRPGDTLITSGLDGVLPAGINVARVVRVDNRSTSAFDQIDCTPTARVDREDQVLVIDTLPSQP